MNRWLALAKEPDEKANPLPDTLTEPDKRGLCPVLSGCRVEKSEREAPRDGANADPPRAFSITGRPLTWTGRVVSLDEWRKLSAREREGPAGRLFCGICREWVSESGACREPGCWKGDEG